MAHDPEESRPGRGLDEDAAWRAIVEHYGERARLDEPEAPVVEPGPSRTEPEAPEERGPAWEDDDHFVPPEPPPLPMLEPRRKAAWIGLFASPLVMLLVVVLGWSVPRWVMGLLVLGFVGGFAYLVATMPRRPPDGWSGDDGAVV